MNEDGNEYGNKIVSIFRRNEIKKTKADVIDSTKSLICRIRISILLQTFVLLTATRTVLKSHNKKKNGHKLKCLFPPVKNRSTDSMR